ncbi:MAG: hypothetical protein ACLP9L_09035 [Thermoguttaceae bacterium]
MKKAPDDLLTRQVVAIWALDKSKIAFAKEQADAALRIEASDPKRYASSNVGRMLRGLIALWEKDWPMAEDLFQKVLIGNPDDLVVRNNLALALVEQDDPAKKQLALTNAEANYRDKNSGPDALWTLGWVYVRRGDFDLAGLALELAVKATNDDVPNADAATYLAHVLYDQNKKWEAKEILDKVLNGDRLFSMRPEALKLYEKVKDAKKTKAAPTAKTSRVAQFGVTSKSTNCLTEI